MTWFKDIEFHDDSVGYKVFGQVFSIGLKPVAAWRYEKSCTEAGLRLFRICSPYRQNAPTRCWWWWQSWSYVWAVGALVG